MPVNGSWSAWGEYSSCDKSCGGGWKLRFRKCNSPAQAHGGIPCIGDSVEPRGFDGNWSAWPAFGQCSTSCGKGVQNRTRTCSDPAPQYGGHGCHGISTDSRPCSLTECPVDGMWGQWGHFRPCDMSCGGGIHIKLRQCNNPPPSHGGLPCPGHPVQTEACNSQPCPVTDLFLASTATRDFGLQRLIKRISR
ncbi:semaphorin-5A-like [Saccostrea cucullata]|uniref:semaphorin-5A-like n=1 Tax=Saccostrea cuccullata TaxID=36930 RepID=UPI002ED6AABE